MATIKTKIMRANGSGTYDQLLPETSIAQVTDLQQQLTNINTNINSKQAQLTAGNNITISNNTIDTKVYPCNPNMLTNWYFGKPVNQRGQTSYSGGGTKYTIDRWRMQAPNSASYVNVNNGYVTVAGTSGEQGYNDFVYYFEEKPTNETVTLTALLTDGTIITRTGKIGEMAAIINQWRSSGVGQPHVALRFGSTPYNIVAVKMELGDTQTLCHMGSDGKYVLNEIPNYQQQLAQCQRYCIAIDHQTYKRADTASLSQFWFYIPLPVTLRSNPSMESGNTPTVYSFNPSSQVAQTGFTFTYESAGAGDASLRVRATKNNHNLSDATLFLSDVVFSCEIV